MDLDYEARDRRLLDNTSSGVEITFSFLASVSNEINRLFNSGHGNHKLCCCCMSIAIAGLLFIFYLMIHSVSSTSERKA